MIHQSKRFHFLEIDTMGQFYSRPFSLASQRTKLFLVQSGLGHSWPRVFIQWLTINQYFGIGDFGELLRWRKLNLWRANPEQMSTICTDITCIASVELNITQTIIPNTLVNVLYKCFLRWREHSTLTVAYTSIIHSCNNYCDMLQPRQAPQKIFEVYWNFSNISTCTNIPFQLL